MGDHLGSIHFVFFSVAGILGKLGKFANLINQLEFWKNSVMTRCTICVAGVMQ